MKNQVKYNVNSFENKGRFLKSLIEWYLMKPELIRKKRQQFLNS